MYISNGTYYLDGNVAPSESPTSTPSKIHLRESPAAKETLNFIVLRAVMHLKGIGVTKIHEGELDALFGDMGRVPAVSRNAMQSGLGNPYLNSVRFLSL